MKILNFAKNLTKSALRGFKAIVTAVAAVGLLVGGYFICLYIIGYTSSLVGFLIAPKQGNAYIVTGYCAFVVFALLYIISITIREMYVKIKEIWQDS